MAVTIETRDPDDPELDPSPHFDADLTHNPRRGALFNFARRWVKPLLRNLRAAYYRRQFSAGHALDLELLSERHHNAYGIPWAVGREQFEFFKTRGLARDHDVAELGCGTLRLGIWLIRHLHAGRYCGIDNHRRSLEAAVRYEIPLHDLEAKAPRLLHDARFSLDHFGRNFDWVISFSVLEQLDATKIHRALRNTVASLKPRGRFVINHALPVSEDAVASYGLRLAFEGQYPCRILTFGTGWREYVYEPA